MLLKLTWQVENHLFITEDYSLTGNFIGICWSLTLSPLVVFPGDRFSTAVYKLCTKINISQANEIAQIQLTESVETFKHHETSIRIFLVRLLHCDRTSFLGHRRMYYYIKSFCQLNDHLYLKLSFYSLNLSGSKLSS